MFSCCVLPLSPNVAKRVCDDALVADHVIFHERSSLILACILGVLRQNCVFFVGNPWVVWATPPEMIRLMTMKSMTCWSW